MPQGKKRGNAGQGRGSSGRDGRDASEGGRGSGANGAGQGPNVHASMAATNLWEYSDDGADDDDGVSVCSGCCAFEAEVEETSDENGESARRNSNSDNGDRNRGGAGGQVNAGTNHGRGLNHENSKVHGGGNTQTREEYDYDSRLSSPEKDPQSPSFSNSRKAQQRNDTLINYAVGRIGEDGAAGAQGGLNANDAGGGAAASNSSSSSGSKRLSSYATFQNFAPTGDEHLSLRPIHDGSRQYYPNPASQQSSHHNSPWEESRFLYGTHYSTPAYLTQGSRDDPYYLIGTQLR